MRKKNQQLEQLLRSQKKEQPSDDFTNDIMQMISTDAILSETAIPKSIKVEQAPKHITNHVMESIIPGQPKSYDILTTIEKRNAIIIFLTITLMCAFIGINAPKAAFTDPTSVDIFLSSIISSSPSGALLLLIGGTGLWIADKYIRTKLRMAKSN